MLLILFQMGQDRYALDIRDVIEVAPLARLKQIPQAPGYVSGILSYRGQPVPVIDLSHLSTGVPSRRLRSTRIILVNYLGQNQTPHILGLMAERVTETLKSSPGSFADAGIIEPDAPYLGPVIPDAAGMIQLVQTERLLPQTVRDALFSAQEVPA